MTLFRPVAAISALVLAVTLPGAAMAQRSDAYTWKLGLDAGIMTFQTRSQDTKVIPSAGAHILVMVRRGGLQFGFDEGIGSNEKTSSNLVLFNDIRRYQAVLLAFPKAGKLEPYFGAGGGILQVVGPRVDPVVTDPSQRATLLSAAEDASASAFATILGGLQGRWGRMTAFVQYQATTSPSDDKLLKGATQSLLGGIRIGLGSA